ncbi:hypothetical protein OEA41_010231 [Lepraria neglecta]|uniref:Uncharacterized protein n=1 Tax=Lepraria neglecta TaxID=209136 RepID=A0AAD9YXE6_9LECA|nr:hypothetical protein OEA41_010231 [Lepraria neglecta]
MCQPHDEQAVLNYLEWQKLYGTEKPFQLFSVVGGGHLPDQRTTNLVFKEGEVETIHDVRGTESQYSLNKQGFTFRIYPTRVHDFGVRDEVENVYLPEIEELLRREVEGIDQVYRWHYLNRQRKDEVTLLKMFDSDPEVEAKLIFKDGNE